MPASDGTACGFDHVGGHPRNAADGLQTAATPAMAARHLAWPGSAAMALIGTGAHSEFRALAFRRILEIDAVHLFDVDPAAAAK